MIDVLGDIIPFGVGVALSPFPIIAVLLLLTAPVGIGGGLLFLVGRAVGFALLTAVFALLSGAVDASVGSTLPAALLRIGLGAALIALALWKFATGPRGDDEPGLPRWMQSIDGMGGAASLRLGVVLTVANPKEIAFAAGAGLTIGGAFLPVGQVVVAGLVFVVLACLSVAIPVVAVAVGADRVTPGIAAARAWLVRNSAVVMAAVLLMIGAMALGSGISGLTG